MIDWNIRVGDLVIMASFAASILLFAYRAGGLSQKFDDVKSDLDELKSQQGKLLTLLTQVAVQESRLDTLGDQVNTLDKRIEDMRRGYGFIVERGQHHP